MKKKMVERKPRNHIVIAMTKRGGAGAHRTSNKAVRQQQKMALKRQETGKVSFFMGIAPILPMYRPIS